MRTKNFATVILLSISILAHSQTLVVRDKIDKEPLEFVSIISPERDFVEYTDVKGRVDISTLQNADSIIIHMIGYEDLLLSYDSIMASGFEIGLEAKHMALEEIVVSASRWQESASDISMKVSSIPQRKVQMQNPQTSADLVGLSGEVFIQKSQQGGGSPMIRGFSANRVLIAVDGVRMNNAIFRSGNLQNIISIDPMAVSQAEVIFGPGSTLFGSDAIGGVMNIHTIDPLYSTDTANFTDANAAFRYATASRETSIHTDFRIGGKKWASATSLSYSNFGDLEMGSRGPEVYRRPQFVELGFTGDRIVQNEDPDLQVGTAYNQYNILQKIGYKANERLEFIYSFHYSGTGDIPRYDRLIQKGANDTLRYAQWNYGPQKWMMHSIGIRHSGNNAMYDDMKAVFAYQNFEESREARRFGSSFGTINTETVDAFSVNLDLKKKLDQKTGLFYGMEGVYNKIGSSADIFKVNNNDTTGIAGNSTRYPDGSDWLSVGAYLSAKSNLRENLMLHAGLRYNLVSLNAAFDSANFLVPVRDISLNTSAVTGSFGLNYKPEEEWTLTLNLSSGFRAPNIDDVSKVFDSEPGTVLVPNSELSPEYAYSADIGVRRSFEDAFFFKANAFYTILENAMVRRDFLFNGQDSIVYQGELSRVQAIQNAASAFVYGFQMGMDINFTSWLMLELKYNWQHGEEELDDGSVSSLRHVAPNFGSVQLMFRKKKLDAILYYIYNGEISYDQLAVTERNKDFLYAIDAVGRPYSPSWYTLNLKLAYRMTDHARLQFGIENITDQRYRPYSSGIAAAGRNFIAALRVGF